MRIACFLDVCRERRLVWVAQEGARAAGTVDLTARGRVRSLASVSRPAPGFDTRTPHRGGGGGVPGNEARGGALRGPTAKGQLQRGATGSGECNELRETRDTRLTHVA